MKKLIYVTLTLMFALVLISCDEIEKDPDIEEKYYTVEFESFSNVEIEEIKVLENDTLETLPLIDQDNKLFLGWFYEDTFQTKVEDGLIVDKDLKLYALWTNAYMNPTYFGPHGADPHIIRHENSFYIYVTGGHIIKSDNMVNWEIVGNLFPESHPNWGTRGAGIWAPDIVKIGDKFMVYYSHSTWGDPNPGIGVMSADHPEGPWIDHGKLFNSEEIGVPNSIDANVFVEDQNVYIIWGSFKGMYMTELTSDGLSLKNGVEYAKNNKVHIAGFPANNTHNSRTYEGAYIIKKEDYYYLFLSTGDCCPQDAFTSSYNVVVSRSKNITGPYVDHLDRDMRGQNLGFSVVDGFIDHFGRSAFGPGHNSIIVDDNNDFWIVYHSYFSDDGLKHNSRQIAIDKLLWDENDWPYVYDRKPSVTKQEVPYFNHLNE